MKRHLTTTEYRELKELVNHILTASSKEEADSHIKSFEDFRSAGGYVGSVNSILSEFYSSLKIMSNKISNNERLSYFVFADSYLSKLKEYIRNEESAP